MMNCNENLAAHINELEMGKSKQQLKTYQKQETRDKDGNWMATRLDNPTHTHLWGGRMGPLKLRNPTDTNNYEQNPKNILFLPPTNAKKYTTRWNRIHTRGKW